MSKWILVIASLFLLACGPGRTTAETQPAPVGWDASQRDPKAVELADKMLAALGGEQTWNGVKQIQFDLEIKSDDKLVGRFSHSWDRWNGRHRYENTSLKSLEAVERGEKDKVEKGVAMYRLFERDRGVAQWNGNNVPSDQRPKMLEEAYDRWKTDTYLLAMPFKVKDPGVNLKHGGEIAADDHCPDGCEVIEITFADGVGTDTYRLNVGKNDSMPKLIELVGENGSSAYTLENWVTVGGLQFATVRDNVGARKAGSPETLTYSNIQIEEPDDFLYVPAPKR